LKREALTLQPAVKFVSDDEFRIIPGRRLLKRLAGAGGYHFDNPLKKGVEVRKRGIFSIPGDLENTGLVGVPDRPKSPFWYKYPSGANRLKQSERECFPCLIIKAFEHFSFLFTQKRSNSPIPGSLENQGLK